MVDKEFNRELSEYLRKRRKGFFKIPFYQLLKLFKIFFKRKKLGDIPLEEVQRIVGQSKMEQPKEEKASPQKVKIDVNAVLLEKQREWGLIKEEPLLAEEEKSNIVAKEESAEPEIKLYTQPDKEEPIEEKKESEEKPIPEEEKAGFRGFFRSIFKSRKKREIELKEKLKEQKTRLETAERQLEEEKEKEEELEADLQEKERDLQREKIKEVQLEKEGFVEKEEEHRKRVEAEKAKQELEEELDRLRDELESDDQEKALYRHGH